MGSVERDDDGNLVAAIESESDAVQLRATVKASDGADEVLVEAGKTVSLDPDNPFNFFALWATDFTWSADALRLALDCLVPVAQSGLHLHTRSHKKMMRRMTSGITPNLPPKM